jgi:hypothetical protein
MKNLIIITILFFSVFSLKENDAGWINLLDKDLTQWDKYLSYKFLDGYNWEQPKDKDGNLIEPIGKNKDELHVFSVITEENEPVLKVSGEVYGCVYTKEEYDNYHLRLKVKWGDNKFEPRKKLLRDSGVLYHSIGPLGAEHWRSWMLSQEFQIMEGHMGDFWSQKSSAIDIKAFIPEYIMNPVADESQPFISLGTGEEIQGFCLRSANYEKLHGEWNTLELICFEGKSIHMVNGHVVMILKNSRYIENGKSIPLERGKIQLQSEAAEVYYKNIEIRNMENLPNEYSKYFDE